MNCQEFEELSGAYVLGAVTSEERQAAEEHLAGCAKCGHLLQELQVVVNVLPLAAPAVAPSPEMKERILSSIRAIADLPPAVRHGHKRRRVHWWSERLATVAAATLLVLCSAMIIWNIVLQQQFASLTQRAQALAAWQYNIQGTTTVPQAYGQLIYFPRKNMTMIVMHDLPETQGFHVYQAWLMRGNQAVSIGLLNVENGIATVGFVGDLRGFDQAAVSLEPGPRASKSVSRDRMVAEGLLTHPIIET